MSLLELLRDSHHRANSCTRKIQYWSPILATRAAYHLEEIGHGCFDVYGCGFCGAYHVGGSFAAQSFDYG